MNHSLKLDMPIPSMSSSMTMSILNLESQLKIFYVACQIRNIYSATYSLRKKFTRLQVSMHVYLSIKLELFESPFRITWEMPLMILTDSKQIFQRRKRRLRKLMCSDESSLSSPTSSRVSSILSHSTVIMLNQSPSDITFLNMSGDNSFAFSSSSFINAYNNPSSLVNVEKSLVNLKQQIEEERIIIRNLVESQVRHLILQFNSK